MEKRGRGRPSRYGRFMNHLHTRAPEPMRDYIRRVGGGNVSEGLREVVRMAWASEIEDAAERHDWEVITLSKAKDQALQRLDADPFLRKYKEILMPDENDIDPIGQCEFVAFAPREAILDRLILFGGGEYPKLEVPA